MTDCVRFSLELQSACPFEDAILLHVPEATLIGTVTARLAATVRRPSDGVSLTAPVPTA